MRNDLSSDEAKSMIRLSPMPVFKVSSSHKFTFANLAGNWLLEQLNLKLGNQVPESMKAAVTDVLENGTRHTINVSTKRGTTYAMTISPTMTYSSVSVFAQEVQPELPKASVLSTFFKELDLAVLEIDNNDRIVMAHDRFCEMTGFSKKELVGANMTQLILTGDFKSTMSLHNLKRMMNKPSEYEVELKSKSGKVMRVEVNAAPIVNSANQVVGSVAVHKQI